MAFKLTKIVTEDTNDIIEGMATTTLLLSSILYDDVMEKKAENYAHNVKMAYQGLKTLTDVMKMKVEGFNVSLPAIHEPQKGFCSFCGKEHKDLKRVAVVSDNVSICDDCVIMLSDELKGNIKENE